MNTYKTLVRRGLGVLIDFLLLGDRSEDGLDGMARAKVEPAEQAGGLFAGCTV
jgi:hypothetical protein